MYEGDFTNIQNKFITLNVSAFIFTLLYFVSRYWIFHQLRNLL